MDQNNKHLINELNTKTLLSLVSKLREQLDIGDNRLHSLLMDFEVKEFEASGGLITDDEYKKLTSKIKTRMKSLSGEGNSITFKTVLSLLMALKIPKVSVSITVHPNVPKDPLRVTETLSFKVADTLTKKKPK